jgi:hypothetical protein
MLWGFWLLGLRKSAAVCTQFPSYLLSAGKTTVNSEHLLLAILDDPETVGFRVLETLGLDTSRIRSEVRLNMLILLNTCPSIVTCTVCYCSGCHYSSH